MEFENPHAHYQEKYMHKEIRHGQEVLVSNYGELPNPTDAQINCEHPTIILNPKYANLINKGYKVHFRGQLHYNDRTMLQYNDKFEKKYSVRRNAIQYKDLPDCYFLDLDTGQQEPLYICVPCNHCDLCGSSKQNIFASRCLMETQMYDCMPIACTLTYAQAPKDGLQVRDVQLFLKRLRKYIDNHFPNRQKIRYCVVGEYGSKYHRPHYHAIIWNLKTSDDYNLNISTIKEILEKCWQHGFVRRPRIINVDKNDKFFEYTAKYLHKGTQVPKGKNPAFMLSSRKNGGIGAAFIDKHKDEILKLKKECYEYQNKFSGKIETIPYCRYVLNRCIKSFNQLIDADYRRNLSTAAEYINEFRNRAILAPHYLNEQIDDCEQLLRHIKPYYYTVIDQSNMFVPNYITKLPNDELTKQLSLTLDDLQYYHYNKDDIEMAWKEHCYREVFLGTIFARPRHINVHQKKYQIEQARSKRKAREIE